MQRASSANVRTSSEPRPPQSGAACPWPRAISLVTRALGQGDRTADRIRWRVTRESDNAVVRVELYGPPRQYVCIVDSSKGGLRGMRMIDIYDEVGLAELDAALAELAPKIAQQQ